MQKSRWAAVGLVLTLASLTSVEPVQAAEPAGEVVSLEFVLQEVPRRHETWEISEMQIRQSEASRRQVLAALLPQLSTQGRVTRQSGDEVSFADQVIRRNTDWAVTTTLGITLFDGASLFAYRQADRLVDATEANVEWRRHLLLLEAELSFYLLAAAQREVEIAEAAIEWRQFYLEQAQAMVEAGMAIAVDVSRARAQVLEAEQALLEARVVRGNAADNLAYLLGRELDGTLRVELDAEDVVPGFEDAPGTVTEERGDFGARRQLIEAAEFGRQAVWWGFVPRLGLNFNSQLGTTSQFNPDPHTWSVSLVATWNLYDGGARYGRLDQTEAQILEQELELQRDLRQASLELTQSHREWRTATAAISVAEEQVEVARETFEMVTARFESGMATSLEVNDASQELLRSELRLNQIRLQARLAEVQVRYLELF